MSEDVRWAVLGTANIAARAFLPALRAAGGGTAVVVGSRDPAAAGPWAADNGVSRTADYAAAVSAPDVDAVYIAVPNDQHVRWATAALDAGKAVLCEKPLSPDAADVDRLLARAGDALLWEAFVFPFHPQTALLTGLCGADGPLGGLRQIVSEFHFSVSSPTNIRWDAALGGGALLDVGCYPVRLARLLFDGEPTTAVATARWRSGVDADIAAVLDFDTERQLVFSAGLERPASTFTRLIGSTAELRVTNPFHPTERDTVELWQDGSRSQAWPAGAGSVFLHAVEHVHAVLRGEQPPRFLAASDAAGNARALDLVRTAALAGPVR